MHQLIAPLTSALSATISVVSQERQAMQDIDRPAAIVRAGHVTHPLEGVEVKLPHTATYVGGERFILYGNADTEIHVFVEANPHRVVSRLYWIQFESYLPNHPDRRYNYVDGNHRAYLGGKVTWTGGGPRLFTKPDRPGSDRAHVLSILTRAGYSVPDEMMSARLVQLLDDPEGTGRGRRELMLIYSEDLASTGRRYSDLVADGQTTAAWDPLETPLISRATSKFSITYRSSQIDHKQ